MTPDWANVAIQAGGAIAVCGMFLWFLKTKQAADDIARDSFLAHLEQKDIMSASAIDRQMVYLRERDAQSKEIAISGHDALREISREVHELSSEIRREQGGQ